MNIWDWTDEWAAKAYESEDDGLIELYQTLFANMRLMHSNPDAAAGNLASNAEAARRRGEVWWALLNEHWRLQVLLNCSRDYGAALDVAVRAAVEARKPIAAGLPQRVCLHEDLISTYIGIDAQGHAGLIQDALDYMEREVDPAAECYYCLLGLKREFAMEMGRYGECAQFSFQVLSEFQKDVRYRDHHGPFVFATLCRVALSIRFGPPPEEDAEEDPAAVFREQVENLLAWAVTGENVAVKEAHERIRPALTMWHAVAARLYADKLGETNLEEIGDHQELYKSAHRMAASLTAPPDDGFYSGWRTYHDYFGEWEGSLASTDAMLAGLAGKGRRSREARGEFYRCFALWNLERLTSADVDRAEAAARLLVQGEQMLADLGHLRQAAFGPQDSPPEAGAE